MLPVLQSLLSSNLLWIVGGVFFAILMILFACVRVIPNNRVGIIEKLWSLKGSLTEGKIIAMNGEAGFQSNILRGGIHLWLWRWQYSVHKMDLVSVKQGEIGYVFARDGKPLQAGQTLAKVVECNNFQDAAMFLNTEGEKGRQRAILREGVYAINLSLFNVITSTEIYGVEVDETLRDWQGSLASIGGFYPVVVGGERDNIAIVTCHDGPSLNADLNANEIIAPSVGMNPSDENFHNNYQNPEAFLRAGGRRGRQYAPLLDGTYFINRWFATMELVDKLEIPVTDVGVVVSYYGQHGTDLSGTAFRHGERVHEGERGVWAKPLGPGKYPFNTYAGKVIRVPTTNFVLHWITGRTENHKFDDSLRSIDLVTADAYEPTLPLSVVVHIDYEKAPNVIQRFGDVKQLITQTLDPLLSAYFRDVSHKKTMLELIHDRDTIQKEARTELKKRFQEFDIECVDVLIGKPDTASEDNRIETLLDQLRQRQLATEQLATYAKQKEAASGLQSLKQANALAEMQTNLTNSKVEIEIASNRADANLAAAHKEAEQMVVLAKAKSESTTLLGKGEADRINQVGEAEASVLQKKVESYGDSRLYALNNLAERLSQSVQPLVPQQLFMSSGDGGGASVLDTLLQVILAEKMGVPVKPVPAQPAARKPLEEMTTQEKLDGTWTSHDTAKN
jgi:uncharacterized membrane protein YqiK